jgi:hypothetical protein
MRALAVSIVLIGAAVVLASGAVAEERPVQLRDAPGKDLVLAHCAMCHSLDYIPMNSRFLDRKGWEASVTKMIKVMGAPISPENAAKIVDYLASEYATR